MRYIWEVDFKAKFLSYLLGAIVFGGVVTMASAAPASSFAATVVSIFLGTYATVAVWVVLRTVWLTFWRRRKQM